MTWDQLKSQSNSCLQNWFLLSNRGCMVWYSTDLQMCLMYLLLSELVNSYLLGEVQINQVIIKFLLNIEFSLLVSSWDLLGDPYSVLSTSVFRFPLILRFYFRDYWSAYIFCFMLWVLFLRMIEFVWQWHYPWERIFKGDF